MKPSFKPVVILALPLFCAACVGTGPNTQQGAVAGGALGALAGAIIGNNSHGHNALGGALIGGAAGAIAGGTIGNSVDHERGTIYSSRSEAVTTVVAAQPPPPPPAPVVREVIVERPAPTAVWVAGHWEYVGRGGYVWVAGHWAFPPRARYAYVEPHWEPRGGTYVYVRGYWR
jgi:hypothetical protein